MKKLLALLLALVMVMSLAACGGDKEDKEGQDVLGLYVCTGIEAEGEFIEMKYIDDENEYSLELKRNGKGILILEGDEFDCKWELDGEDFTLVTDDDSVDAEGTLKDGVIELEIEDSIWVFEMEDAKKSSGKDKDKTEGDEEDGDSILGRYVAKSLEVDGEEIDVELIFGDAENSVELLEDGECIFTLDDDAIDCTYEMDGEEISILIVDSGEEMEAVGSVVDGVMVLDFLEYMWTFELTDGKTESKKENKKDSSAEMIVIGDFEAEYLGCEIVEDDDGEDVLVLAFEFFNGSDEDESFAWAYYYDVRQNGTALLTASIYPDADSYDTLEDTAWEDIEPGDSKYVFLTFIIDDMDADVEIEFSDISMEKTVNLTVDLDDAEEGLIEMYY